MKKFVKNEIEIDEVEVDAQAIKEAYDRMKKQKKYPTSINLPENIVLELKECARKEGIPYQTLMRKFVIEGLEKFKKSA